MEDEMVTNDGLLKFAESCILTPSLLARRLRLDDSTIEQIQFGHQNDRYEQIYQMLMKWKQSQPSGTWKDLEEATDSGVKRVLNDIYQKKDRMKGNSNHHEDEKEGDEYGPPPSKVSKEDSPLPSAPSFDLVYPVQEVGHGDNVEYTKCNTTDHSCENEKNVNSTEELNHDVHDDKDRALTYDDDYSTILDELGHETQWFELGLALRLKPSLLDEIKVTNREKVSDCRRDTIKEWLKNPRHTYTPTWRTLCTALRQDMVGNIALANRIARKYDLQ